jgi:hypothetical protein
MRSLSGESSFMAMIEWQVLPSWFELDTRTRRDYTVQIQEIIRRYPKIRFRWFDAEAWTGKFTDFSLCEFDDLDSYNSLWGDLRRHPFLSTPFANASRVIMGMELDTLSAPAPESGPEIVEGPLETLACANCGYTLKVTARFCGGCGSPNQALQGS